MSEQTQTPSSEPGAGVNRILANEEDDHCVHRVPLGVRCWDCQERRSERPLAEDATAVLQTPPDDLSSIGYPSKEQIETAIADIAAAGMAMTWAVIADAIAERAGLRPGEDVVEALIAHYGIATDATE